MPHKQNPISSENITGLSRMVRSYALASMENIPLWHERDISHSSVERVFFPDAFILAHYATRRLKGLLTRLVVQKEKMRENVESSLGLLMSSHVLLMLINKGMTREEAYLKVQALSFEAKKSKVHLKDLLLREPSAKSKYSKKDLDEIFTGKLHLRNQKVILSKVINLK